MFNITTQSDRLTCTFPERMDTLACEKYQEQINQQVSRTGLPVTFDLSGVGYVASSFIRICMRAAQAVGRDHFDMINVAPEIKKVFKIAGLDQQLNIR
ncbi:MAG: STAS domain-containing protein [candidate division NC10 bacterium]